ncbi:hypothetical protein CUMW_240050, partial [Citrus unshiu]
IKPEIRTRSSSTYFLVLITLHLEIFSDLKNMETPFPCAGKNEWLEGTLVPVYGIADDKDGTIDNLDLIVVPQYGRNPDHTG